MGGFKTPFPLVLITVFMLIAGANAHIDQDDLGQVSHKPDETWYDRPSPPPPSRDELLIGGLYDENRGPLLLKENHTYEMVCSVFIKPPAFMYVAPGVTIHVRGDCGGDDAYAWGASNPGGVSMKPSIVILPNARLEVKGTLAKPVVIRSLAGAGSASTTNGLWGGVYLFGRARVSFDLLDANRMPVGTAEGADPGPYGLAVSDTFVARNAPDGTFTVCEDEIIDGNCTTKMAPSCVDITQARENGDGFLSASEHKFEYGGDDDGGSCGSVENLIVVNAGGIVDNNSTTVPNPVAFGLYGCGVGTSIANLEVAHSGGIGVELRGGAALLKDVAVWATKGDGVVARGGYRGVLRNAFVDVDGASPRSALRVVGDWDGDQSQTDDVAYRTHPHVYGGTFVASGDGGGGYDVGSFYEENRANTVLTGIVATERAGGLTLVNSIVLSRSFSRTRGVTISGCSHAMDVGNENTIGAPNTTKVFTSTNRVFISDKNVITGFGVHPNVSGVPDFGAFPTSMREVFDANGQSRFVGANTTRRAVIERWLANLSNTETHTSFDASKFTTAPPREWRAFGLVGDSCQNTLSNADDRKPQLHSSLFPSELFLTDEGNSADQPGFFDPRPTPAMRYAHSTDDPFVNAHRGFALGTPSAERTALALDAIDRFLSSPVTYPGAFTPDKNSLWFRDRTEPLSVKGATLSSQVAKDADRKYAHLTLTREFQHPTDANENKCVPLVNVMMEENQCYRAPAWLEERISPLALGVARLGSFDQTSTWRQSKLFPNDSTNATYVLADVPYNLTHDLLANANGDPESNSWAGGSVVAQLVADAVLATYKRGSRSVGVNAHVAVIFAAHLNRTHGAIPAGVFTRGDATRVFANPTETFVRVHMSGLELKTFLESAMCSSDPEGAPFPFASGVRWDYDNVTTPAASNFAVLAPGSDRVWVPLDDADAFVVVMPYSVAVDTSNTWSGVGVSSFASGFSIYSVGDGDFKTVFAEHAEALGVLTQTSPGTRSMRTFTGASGVHAHAFDKGNEMHVKLNVTEGQIPVLIQFVSYDACVADAVEGVAVATGVFVAATPETCASATNDAVRIIATGITPGSIDSTGKVVTAEWTNVVHGGAPASASCPTGATTHDLAVALFTFYDAASTPPAYSFPKTAAPISSYSDSSYAKKKRRKLLFAGAGADRRVAPRSSSGLRKLKSSSGGRKLKSTETRAKSASRSLLETYTWPAQSTWCELWRADEVCNGNAVDSAEKCPTGPPYNCVWENASCKSQPADMEGFGSYKNGVVNETSFLRTLEASLGGLNCSAAGCGDNSGCVTVNASHCKPSIAGTRQVMTNTSANDAITVYAVAHVMHDVCRVDAPGEDLDACNAIQGCVYQGYCSGEQNNHQSCGQRNSSSCETQNCAWGWNASLSANVCTGTGVGTNGDCADNNSSESCLANTCSFYGCTVNDDYSRVQIATACGAAYEDDYIATSNNRADWTQVAARANGAYSSGSSEVNALCGAWVLVSLCEAAHAAGANAAETCPPAALAGICSFNSTDGVCDAGVDVQGQWDTSMVVPVLQVINGYGCEASVNCDDPGCFLDGNGDCLVTPATAKQAVEQANGNAVHATWAYQVPLTTDGYCGLLSNNQTACDTHPACVHDGTAVCSMKPGFDHWIVGDACVAASGMTGLLDLLASYSGYQSFENLALAMNSSTAIAPSPSLSPSPSTGETGCYALSTDTTPIAGCTCHETCAKCGYFNWPNTDDDCVTCADPSVTVTAVYGDGTGYCTPYTGIPPRAGADVAGSPCYHVIGSDDPASKQRRGTVRFFCDKTGGLTQLKWFATGSPNPGCDMSVPPDELTYGAHSINSRHDLAACDDASEYDVALGRRFPKIEASCGGFDLAAFYSRTDGKVGPFASTYRYRIPVAQRTESAPWGCGTAGCVKARQLGYAV